MTIEDILNDLETQLDEGFTPEDLDIIVTSFSTIALKLLMRIQALEDAMGMEIE